MAGTVIPEIKVKPFLVHGEKFIKWDDETGAGSPVVMRMDSQGHFLYWTYQNKQIHCLALTDIRDTRVGTFARVPKNPKIREIFDVDNPDSNFYSKCLTVVSGPDFPNLAFDNFVAFKTNVVKDWAAEILNIAIRPLTHNASRLFTINKMYTKIKIFVNEEKRIPVKNIYQMFPADRKRVEAALTACNLPSQKTDMINPEDFTELVFKQFITQLCPRPEIDQIFELMDVTVKPYLTRQQLSTFINETQRDARLNNFLFPLIQPDQTQKLIEKYEPNRMNANKGHLSLEGLGWYLSGPENSLIFSERLTVYQDMTQPLSHYFINSSHNTYLTAGQFSGISSPEMYRQVLLAGCRCLELDCWKGKPPEEEPIITHGYTMTTEILFKDVIEAIAESAFKTSQYPVILSFENHVDSPKQQAKMADYCRTIFGDMLLTETMEKYPLKPGTPIPSPQELMGKILIKNKKNQASSNRSQEMKRRKSMEPMPDQAASGETMQTGETEEEQCENEEEQENIDQEDEEEQKKNESDEGTAGQEARAYEEMSSLVNYIQPVKFVSFELSKERNLSYIISSFTETKALDLLIKSSVDFVEYNERQMSRIYPKGTRMDSSNYLPHVFWNAGCQMVALNFQTTDVPMQLNNSCFEFNGRSGYILKHKLLCCPDKKFDPFTADQIDVVAPNSLSILIISGQFLSDRNSRFYVDVELFGLPNDPKQKFKTKLTLEQNSINPQWRDEEPFVFEKILVPELAFVRIATYEESGKFIGHRILPVTAIQTGYHHIGLRNEANQLLTMPTLFAYIEVRDYVPHTWADLTKALTDPINFVRRMNIQSEQDSSAACSKDVSEDKAQMQESGSGATDSNEACSPTNPTCTGLEESSKDAVEAMTTDELKTQKAYIKMQRKHEKELKELERKIQKKKNEVIQKYTSSFAEQYKRKQSFNKSFKKKRNVSNTPESGLSDSLMSSGPEAEKWSELKDNMEADLMQVYAEQYELIRNKKEQHIIEQVAKLVELAKEKQAIEMKNLKESGESEMKEVKKKLEQKRQEKIETMLKTTADKIVRERRKKEITEHHIQVSVKEFKLTLMHQSKLESKLQEKHAADFEEIKEKEKEYQLEAQNEYEAKMKALPQVISELIKSTLNTKFTQELERLQCEGKDLPETKACELSSTLPDEMTENPVPGVTQQPEDDLQDNITVL
ncbi:1-phosphatidylinositol 4,5-bisphosphate phosphodiesterase beta-2-like [Pristis pectinata]|uniref:1-phosphatidylinositol 4,5-bisphosphate phosphodiesterase beta-2-like n=1 Tax=Pristis pectinata TaxID=685728 RepID=UPI00223D9AD2|nr:1-phosphatidylinositol 4,5-bisphosphate phosphodiesterase beta-2-like [Pristis pectinata]